VLRILYFWSVFYAADCIPGLSYLSHFVAGHCNRLALGPYRQAQMFCPHFNTQVEFEFL
jgi:hypothetical protein